MEAGLLIRFIYDNTLKGLMKRGLIVFLLIICSAYAIDIDSCQTLSQNSATYVLTQDVSSSGNCFQISGNGITLDLNEHTVTYDTSSGGHGVQIGASGVTVTNGIIIQGNGGSSKAHAIESSGAGSGELSYLVIYTHGVQAQGIAAYNGLGGTEIRNVYIDGRLEKNPARNEDHNCIQQDYCNSPCDGDIHDNILVNCHIGISMEESSIGPGKNIYNNLIQHKRRPGIKQPMGIHLSALVANYEVYDNQIITDYGRGIYVSGYGDGEQGPRDITIRDNRVDVDLLEAATAGSGNYPENNAFGLYDRYGAGRITYTNNIILADNHVDYQKVGVFVGSDSRDSLMVDLIYEDNTIISKGEAFEYAAVEDVQVRNNEYMAPTFSLCGWDCEHSGVSIGNEIIESGNSQITPQSYTPAAPTGLRITRFLDSYLLQWNDNNEAQTYEYILYRDGALIPANPEDTVDHITPRGGTFFIDVDAAGSHTYTVAGLNLNSQEGPQSASVSSVDAANGWWDISVEYSCGDGTCDADETNANCAADCPIDPVCGDGNCDSDESCTTCETDCGECPIDCVHEADNNPCDVCIDTAELSVYINQWKSGSVSIQNLMAVINLWKNGC